MELLNTISNKYDLDIDWLRYFATIIISFGVMLIGGLLLFS